MIIETLRITWKMIRRAGWGRTKHTYCRYVAENKNHWHTLHVEEGTKLFNLLSTTIISHYTERYEKHLYVDGIYYKNVLVKIFNPRVK
jgi:hypothetical protein